MKPESAQERWEILDQLEALLDTPMLVLGFAWLALLVGELLWGLSPFLERTGLVIWGVFVFDFVLEFGIAPKKGRYLRRNWLTLLSLFVPALRVFRVLRVMRVLRAARAARGLRLLRILSSANRGMRALSASFGRRGFGYAVALTGLVILLGAAGMLAFERDVQHPAGIHDYGTALWWTAMLVTTMGSGYWPQTPEGRILCLFLSVYAFAVFGYVTATIATFFLGRDVEEQRRDAAEAGQLTQISSKLDQMEARLVEISRRGRGEE